MIDFKECKKIAIIGLSPDPSKPSYQVALYLQKHHYEIFPVYPKPQIILGKLAIQELRDLQNLEIDWVVIFRKSQACLPLVKEILSLHLPTLKGIWLQLGIINDEAKELAIQNGLSFIQDRCIKIEREKNEN